MQHIDGKPVNEIYDLVILGGGVAGLSAAKTAGQSGLRVLLLEKDVFGGCVAVLETVDEFPDFDKSGGWELNQAMVKQAKDVHCELLDSIEAIDLLESADGMFAIKTGDFREFQSRSVTVSTGGQPLMLGLADETHFARHGIHTCVQCAGTRYKGKRVAIAGNNRWAVRAADHLLKLGCDVFYITRDNELCGDMSTIKKVLDYEKFRFLGGCHITGLYGKEYLDEILVTSLAGGNYQRIDISAVFVYRGIKPNSSMIPVSKDRNGFITVDGNGMTSRPGVFAVGRVVQDDLPIQDMAKDGSKAALSVAAWLKVNT